MRDACRAPRPAAFGLALAALAVAGAARAVDETAMTGAAVFRSYCAACHGPLARGDGPLADSLRVRPPDLTRFARRNGGSFPAEKVARIIDGRKAVKGHGGPDMPVWGDAFKNSREGYGEEGVKAKIEALVEHLRRIQVEAGR